MSRDIAPLGLRMPAEIKQQIEDSAKANGRSMNAEILERLQRSFDDGAASEKVRTLEAELAGYKHVANVMQGMPIIFASVVRQLIEAHAKDLDPKKDQLVMLAKDLADAVVHNSGAGMADALSKLLDPERTKGIALEMEAFKKDIATNAAKKAAAKRPVLRRTPQKTTER